jgi:hypothetical protein
MDSLTTEPLSRHRLAYAGVQQLTERANQVCVPPGGLCML